MSGRTPGVGTHGLVASKFVAGYSFGEVMDVDASNDWQPASLVPFVLSCSVVAWGPVPVFFIFI